MTFDADGVFSPTNWEALIEAQAAKTCSEAYAEIAAELPEPNAVHWRLYLPRGASEPVVVCVQEFDYIDYDAARFVEPEAYLYEDLAEEALDATLGYQFD